jgi:polyhydroxyalkanoate synthesis regulator phasin
MAKNTKRTENIIAQSLQLGFGLADITKVKAEKLIKELKKEYDITPAESKRVANKLVKSIQDNKKSAEKFLREQARKVIKEIDKEIKLATKGSTAKSRRSRKSRR